MKSSNPITIAGAMTGTSCDGMDLVVMSFSSQKTKTTYYKSIAYPSGLRKRVLAFQNPGSKHTAQDWMALDRDLGIWYGDAFKRVMRSKKIDVISNHGQTLAHFPYDRPLGTSLQLGDPFIIAEKTGITTIAGHRKGDLAGGGQGAPLAPIFHEKIANDLFKKSSVALHNLGGISNFSYFNKGDCKLAFDTGPGNCLMDLAVEAHTKGKLHFDKNGILASQGKIDKNAVQKILKHSYIKKPIPKSTGRDEFHLSLLKSLTSTKGIDLIATATAMTVETIVNAYERFVLSRGLPLETIVCVGGGARNGFLIQSLRKRLKKTIVLTAEEIGINSQAIEAQAFSYMGYLTLQGAALGGVWTGAAKNSPPGLIVPGKNWNSLLRKLGA